MIYGNPNARHLYSRALYNFLQTKNYFMLPEKILQSNLLDILFENRNKTYGAYTLRKFYNRRMQFALSATVFISACLAAVLLLSHPGNKNYIRTVIIPPDAQLTDINTKPKPVLSPPHIQPATRFRQVNNSAPVIVDNDVKLTQPAIEDIDNSIISDVNTTGDAPPENFNASPLAKGESSQSAAVAPTPVINENITLFSAEVMPEFPGGMNALVKFMLQNLRQPDDLQASEKIKVIASFVVSKTGTIENLKIVNSGRADLDKEVLRVINKMPVWKPGTQNGKTVAVYFNLPVTFQRTEEP